MTDDERAVRARMSPPQDPVELRHETVRVLLACLVGTSALFLVVYLTTLG